MTKKIIEYLIPMSIVFAIMYLALCGMYSTLSLAEMPIGSKEIMFSVWIFICIIIAVVKFILENPQNNE